MTNWNLSWRPTNAEYHADKKHWSPSMFSLFAKSPRLAHERYINGVPGEAKSSALMVGSAINALLLPAGCVPDDGYSPIEAMQTLSCEAGLEVASGDRRSKDFRSLSEVVGPNRVLTAAEFAQARWAADAVLVPASRAAEMAKDLLTELPGVNESAHRWGHEISGGDQMPLKCMMDRLVEVDGLPLYVELKSSNDPTPEAFARSFFNFGYHRQVSHNLDGAHLITGADRREIQVIYVVIGTDDPFSVFVYSIDPDWVALGDVENAELRRAVRDRLSGKKPWVSEAEMLGDDGDTVPTLSPPGWLRNRLG